MPILFVRTGESAGPWRYISIASRYILRAMRMSPRISNESCAGFFAAGGVSAGTLAATSELLFSGVWPLRARLAARTREGRKSLVETHAEKEIIVDPPC